MQANDDAAAAEAEQARLAEEERARKVQEELEKMQEFQRQQDMIPNPAEQIEQ